VTSAAEPLPGSEPGHRAGGGRGRRGWLVRTAVVVVAVSALYLALSLAAPRTVPRLAALPKPAPDRVTYEDCNGHRGARTTERWEQVGAFWVLSTFELGGGCIAT